MTGGTEVATTHGPMGDPAVNQTPPWTAKNVVGLTRMTGVGELTTYCSGVSGTAWNCGSPSKFDWKVASARFTSAVCGMLLAICASCEAGVPGTVARTVDF